MERKTSVVTPERFASGMTFEQYLAYVGAPENLKREGSGRPRSDMTANLRAACGVAAGRRRRRRSSAGGAPNGPAKSSSFQGGMVVRLPPCVALRRASG